MKTREVVSRCFMESSEVPASELPKRLKTMQEYLIDAVEYDCRHFAKNIAEWRDENLWQHFSESWDSFLNEHIKQPQEWIDHICEGVQLLDNSQPIKAQDAVSAAKARAMELAKESEPIAAHGGDRDTKESKQGYRDNLASIRGTSPEYLTARIARDRPDILQKMQQGEYPSVRAAAIDAGIVKPRQRFEVGHSTKPENLAKSLIDKCDRAFVVQLAATLTELLVDE